MRLADTGKHWIWVKNSCLATDLHNSARLHPESNNAPAWEDITMLVRDCMAGNRNAQKYLYNQYSPKAYAIIRRYTRQNEIADEILNDAFYKVFTKIGSYSGTGSFDGWLRRVVVNTITDHMRKYIRDQQVYHAAEMPEDVYLEDDAAGKMAYKELLAIVHELPDTQRMVFNLYVFEELKHKEISEALGITEVNSRWHLSDARRRLKEKINSTMKR